MPQLNTAERNAVLDDIGARLNGGTWAIRTGTAPASDAALTGTVLATGSIAADAFDGPADAGALEATQITGTGAAEGAPGYLVLTEAAPGTGRRIYAAASITITGLVGGNIGVGAPIAIDVTLTYPVGTP